MLLVLGTLFHLQFGLQAMFQAPSQGVFVLVAAGALGVGIYRLFKRKKASAIVFLGTVPLFLYHIPWTIIDAGEMPFLIGSSVVPTIAGLTWLLGYWLTPRKEPSSQ